MMTEAEIRAFVDSVTAGDRATVVDRITSRWITDRQEAADEAREAIHEDARDSWDGT